MFVCNLKVDHKFFFKIGFILLFIIVLIIAGISIYKVFNYSKANDELPIPNIANLTSDNYTNVLKSVHDNLDQYVGQKISFSGYIYRVYDFTENQFVLARNMVISSDNQTLVVGFLCSSNQISNFADGTWVNISGKIVKGDYHGDIPVIEVKEIKECDKPNDEYVYPPEDSYIPTSALF